MKAEELMLNDWVECLDSTHKTKMFAQVDAIEESRNCLLVKDGWGNWFLDISHLEPIPLTEEILVKNGWRKQTMPYKDEWYGGISLFEEHGKFYYMDFKIEYVHQLQQLLRLAGVEKTIEL